MNKKFYLIASLLLASAQMGLAQNCIVKRVDVKDISTVKAPAQAFTYNPQNEMFDNRKTKRI